MNRVIQRVERKPGQQPSIIMVVLHIIQLDHIIPVVNIPDVNTFNIIREIRWLTKCMLDQIGELYRCCFFTG